MASGEIDPCLARKRRRQQQRRAPDFSSGALRASVCVRKRARACVRARAPARACASPSPSKLRRRPPPLIRLSLPPNPEPRDCRASTTRYSLGEKATERGGRLEKRRGGEGGGGGRAGVHRRSRRRPGKPSGVGGLGACRAISFWTGEDLVSGRGGSRGSSPASPGGEGGGWILAGSGVDPSPGLGRELLGRRSGHLRGWKRSHPGG